MRLSKIFIIASIAFLFFKIGAAAQSLPSDLFNDPRFMVVNEEAGRLYVLNNKNQELVVLDIKSRSLIKKIKLEADGSNAMVRNSRTGKIYISHADADKISIIEENKIGQENYRPSSLGRIKTPIALVIDEAGNRIFILSNADEASIFIIDGESDLVIARRSINFNPREMIPDFKSGRIYFTLNKDGGIGVFDIENGETRQLVQAGNYLSGAVDEKYSRIYFSDSTNNRLTVLDGSSGAVLFQIPTGLSPRAITVVPEFDRVYVNNFLGASVTVIDAKTSSVINTISLGQGTFPSKVLANHLSGKLYIPGRGLDKITVVDIRTNRVIKEVESGGRNPSFATINSTANEIYFSNPESNNLVIIDGASDSQAALLPVEAEIGGPIFARPNNVFFGSRNNLIFVLNNSNGTVTVIDGKTDRPVKVIPVGRNPRHLVFTDDYKKIYVTVGDEDKIAVIDGNKLSVVKTIETGNAPDWMVFNSKNDKVYIIYRDSGNLGVIDVKTDSLLKEIKLSERLMPPLRVSQATGRVYVADGASGNKIFVIDSENDGVIRELPFRVSGGSLWFLYGAAQFEPIVSVFSPFEGKFTVFNENDYRILRTISAPKFSMPMLSRIIDERPLLFIPQEDDSIDVIDQLKGERIKKIFISEFADYNYNFETSVWASGEKRLILLDIPRSNLYIYDYGNDKLLAVLPTGREPRGPFIDYRTDKIYIANAQSDSVSVVDAKEGKLLALITNQTPLAAAKSAVSRIYYSAAGLIALGLIVFLVLRIRKKAVAR